MPRGAGELAEHYRCHQATQPFGAFVRESYHANASALAAEPDDWYLSTQEGDLLPGEPSASAPGSYWGYMGPLAALREDDPVPAQLRGVLGGDVSQIRTSTSGWVRLALPPPLPARPTVHTASTSIVTVCYFLISTEYCQNLGWLNSLQPNENLF
jgi:hypothetical protein